MNGDASLLDPSPSVHVRHCVCGLRSFSRRRQPEHLVGQIGGSVGLKKDLEPLHECPEWHLMSEEDAAVCAAGSLPLPSQSEEVPGVVGEDRAAGPSRVLKLVFIGSPEAARLPGSLAVYVMLREE